MIKSIEAKCDGPRWYVEYRSYSPEARSGKGGYVRVREYGGINRERDLVKRRELLNSLFQEISESLGKRFAPVTGSASPIRARVNAYLADMKGTLRPRTYTDVNGTLKKFLAYIDAKNLKHLDIQQITKDHLRDFRADRAKKVANTTVNKEFAAVKTFFYYYKNNFDGVLIQHPGDGLKKLEGAPEMHMAFSDLQVRKIHGYLAEHDPQMLLYCKVIGMGFLRCREARLLKIGDIDLEAKKLTLWAENAKTRERVRKPMLESFCKVLEALQLDRYPPDYYLFSYNGKPGKKAVHDGYFRRRFQPLKNKFALHKKHTIYGFRHYSVSKMIDNGAPWREIMKYTGHSTMAAFEKYARSLGTKPAQDLSEYLNL